MDRLNRQSVSRLVLLVLAIVGLLAGCTARDGSSVIARLAARALSFARGTFGMLFYSALLFLLPGGVVVVWLWRKGSRLERLILSAGLSVAVNALLVYATLSGLRLNRVVVMGFLVLCGAGIVARWILDLRSLERKRQASGASLAQTWRTLKGDLVGWLQSLPKWLISSVGLSFLAMVVVSGLVLGVRLYVVRAQVAPMWGDGLQHTVMAQLIADNGGLFDSWEPYAPLTSFTYHFGFHANVALFHWLSGEPMPKSVTWIGQILNCLAILALYPLALKVSGGKQWAGVGAVLVAGLLMPMPMFYVNWGRYTQLTGQVILPVAVYLTWCFCKELKRGWRVIPVWIAVAGLAVTHYRVLVFYAVFVLAYLILDWGRDTWRRNLGRVAVVGVGAFLLFVPWLVRVLPGQMARTLLHQVTTAASEISNFDARYNSIGDLKTFMAPWAWLLLAVSLGVGIWRRQRSVRLVAVWWFALFVLTNPNWLLLPGTGAISNFALFIALYIPAGILVGNVIGMLLSALGRSRGKTAWLLLGTLAIVLVGLAGARRRVEDFQAFGHALVTPSDMKAMAWIRENTSADARFLVNSFPAYGGTLVVGSDAGWWLPLLAGRANSVPPLNYGAERGPVPDYVNQVNSVTWKLQKQDLDVPETVQMLCERGFTHVYIGQREGRVNYGGPHVLSLEEMLRSPSYKLVHQQDKVSILEISCSP